jgi:hypothetical protein
MHTPLSAAREHAAVNIVREARQRYTRRDMLGRHVQALGGRPGLVRTLWSVKRRRLTYLSVTALADLALVALENRRASIQGGILEAGCARGGSAIMLAAAKERGMPLHVHDVFAQIPAPGERDGADVHRRYATIANGTAIGVGGDTYYGYRRNLLREVSETFTQLGYPPAQNAVHLVRGLFQDTLTADGPPLSLVHVDGDWYDSVMTCLERLAPRLSRGGRFVIDDYDDWSGARRAVDDFLASPAGTKFAVVRWSRVHLVHT